MKWVIQLEKIEVAEEVLKLFVDFRTSKRVEKYIKGNSPNKKSTPQLNLTIAGPFNGPTELKMQDFTTTTQNNTDKSK